MTDTITTADLTIDHGTGQFGPTATITVNAGPLTGQKFTLRSTEHMDDPVNDLSRGGGIHVHAGDGDGFNGWLGVLRTYSMFEAAEGVVEHVNDLAAKKRVEDGTWSERHALREAVDAFDESLSSQRGDGPAVMWRRVLEAVSAMDARIREATVSEEGADRA